MKKVMFAIQVFGLIVLFPLYVIVELNHGTKALPVNNPVPVVIEKPVKKELQAVIKSKAENQHTVLVLGVKYPY